MRLALFALLAGCGFSARAGSDGPSSGVPQQLVDDSATDFGATSAVGDSAVEPMGMVGPAPFVLGGLRARGYDGKFVSGSTTSWSEIENALATATLRGVAYQQLPANWNGGHPMGLGLSADVMPDDNFTVIFDGEVFVTAGDHTITLDADDAGAFEIDPNGNGYALFTLDASAGMKTTDVHADTDMWMPFHAAIGENTGNSQLIIHLDGAALTAGQTRARVTTDQGLLTWIYYGNGAAEVVAGPVLASPNVSWGMAAPPLDLPGNIPSTYSARFMGQIRIDNDGMYTLAATTGSVDDSTGLYIDRHLVARTNSFADAHPASATLMLTAGWHDIMIELSASQKTILGSSDPHAVMLATTMAIGGGGGIPITPAILRPAAASGYMSLAFTSSVGLNDTTTNNGVTTIPVPVSQPAPATGAVIDSTTIGYFYHDATPTDYTVNLDEAGTAKSLPSTAPYAIVFGDESAAGAPVPTTSAAWSFTFTDSVPGNAANKNDQSAFAVVEYNQHGGPLMPFAPVWTYTSGPRDVARATDWGALEVSATLAGATMKIEMRSAPAREELAAATWVVVENGSIPTMPVNPVIEYRLTVSGDGWAYPTVDKVELAYTARPSD